MNPKRTKIELAHPRRYDLMKACLHLGFLQPAFLADARKATELDAKRNHIIFNVATSLEHNDVFRRNFFFSARARII
jgi:hypothetical protein